MNTERLEELVWELIDGTISSQDHLLLQEYLVGRPEAEERRRELVSLAARLDSLETVEPPAALRQRIDAALEAVPSRGPAALPEPLRLPPLTTAAWPMRAGYLAAGLLVGAALTFLVVGGPGQDLDQSKLYGSVQSGRPVESASTIDLEADSGTVIVERKGAQRLLDFDLRQQGAVVMELESGSGMIELESLDQSGSTALGASTAGSRLRLATMGPAALRLTVNVGEPAASLFLTVTAEDATLDRVILFAGEIPYAR
ncbi:MAG: anti-sigma factor [Acidobacteriota bacterium]|nr:anti-sigma factor [Acidobacteriota bacterium]